MAKKEMAVMQDTAMAMTGEAARGFDNFTMDDLIVPRLRLLQGLSQAIVDGVGVMGQFQDSLTGEILGDSVEVVLLGMKNGAVYFEPGKGMKCKSSDGIISMNGDKCSECPFGEFHGKFHDDGTPPKCSSTKEFISVTRKTVNGEEQRPLMISFLKTSYSMGKRLASMARLTGKDIFALAYTLTSEKIKNDKGTFAKFIVKPSGLLTSEEFKAAEYWYGILSQVNVRAHDDDVIVDEV